MAGEGSTSWKDNYSIFTGLYTPFLIKGGPFWDSLYAGRFYFNRDDGYSGFHGGFRSVVVPVS